MNTVSLRPLGLRQGIAVMAVVLTLGAALGGCMVGPDYQPPAVNITDQWSEPAPTTIPPPNVPPTPKIDLSQPSSGGATTRPSAQGLAPTNPVGALGAGDPLYRAQLADASQTNLADVLPSTTPATSATSSSPATGPTTTYTQRSSEQIASTNPVVSGALAGYQKPFTPSKTVQGDEGQTVERWWTTFHDPELESLIDRAVRQNLDLQQATSRLLQARAQRRIIAAGQYPELDGTASYQHYHFSKNGIPLPTGGQNAPPDVERSEGGVERASRMQLPQMGKHSNPIARQSSGGGSGGASGSSGSASGSTGTPSISSIFPPNIDLWQVGFDASYEIDVFGGVRRSVQAANADYQAAAEDRRNVLISLLSEVARDYIEFRGQQHETDIINANIRTQQQTLRLTQEKLNAGTATGLDVERAAAQVATTAAQLPQLQQSSRASIHRLAVLLGQYPDSLAAELSKPASIPVPPDEVPIGLPSDLLRRRPDIRRAERQLAASTARIGVAVSDFYPKFQLTGSVAQQSLKFSELWSGRSYTAGIGPNITWDLFDAGRVRANVVLQTQRQREAYLEYEKSILNALQETEDALFAFSAEQTRHQALTDAVTADTHALDIARQQYDRGIIDFLQVLDAERSLFIAQDALAQSDQTVSTNLVALYKALGGGWASTTTPAK